MELKEILNIIKDDFPDKSIDISESLGLLMDTIDDIMNRINDKMGQAYLNRDFLTAEKYITLGKSINFYENKVDEVINFTRIEENKANKEDESENDNIKSLPNYEEYLVDNKVEHTLYENFTHIRPFGFRIDGEELIEVKTWQEVFLKTCELLLYKDEKKFLQFENKPNMNGKKNKYFSVSVKGMRKPEMISNKIYVETNMSSNSIRNIIVKMLREYDIKVNDFKLYFKADYTNINKENYGSDFNGD